MKKFAVLLFLIHFIARSHSRSDQGGCEERKKKVPECSAFFSKSCWYGDGGWNATCDKVVQSCQESDCDNYGCYCALSTDCSDGTCASTVTCNKWSCKELGKQDCKDTDYCKWISFEPTAAPSASSPPSDVPSLAPSYAATVALKNNMMGGMMMMMNKKNVVQL
jgi:hypothetical protein